jgi:creatinine amidohydrolase
LPKLIRFLKYLQEALGIMELCNLSWQEAKEWASKNPVVVIPTGSTEQHGPHLPMKVDITVANYVAQKVCEKLNMLVTPPLNFGYSEVWQYYPGTLSFTQETLHCALRDICTSLIRGGFRKIFILNGHNGNLQIMQAVAMELIDRYAGQSIQIGCGTYIFMVKEECDKIGENFKDGTHANEMETSLSLALFPELVKMEKAREVSRNYRMRTIMNYDAGAMFLNQWPKPERHHGVYGNPSLASQEKGKAYLAAIIERVAQILRDFDQGKYNPTREDGVPREF